MQIRPYKTTDNKIAVVEGYTDSKDPSSSNVDLARRRAEAVRTYIVSTLIAARFELERSGGRRQRRVAAADAADADEVHDDADRCGQEEDVNRRPGDAGHEERHHPNERKQDRQRQQHGSPPGETQGI